MRRGGVRRAGAVPQRAVRTAFLMYHRFAFATALHSDTGPAAEHALAEDALLVGKVGEVGHGRGGRDRIVVLAGACVRRRRSVQAPGCSEADVKAWAVDRRLPEGGALGHFRQHAPVASGRSCSYPEQSTAAAYPEHSDIPGPKPRRHVGNGGGSIAAGRLNDGDGPPDHVSCAAPGASWPNQPRIQPSESCVPRLGLPRDC